MTGSSALNVFKSPWDNELITHGFLGVCRFDDDFQRRLGISRKVLAERLKALVTEGIFERRQYQLRPERYEYTLTEKGRDVLPVLTAMERWSKIWSPGHDRAWEVLATAPVSATPTQAGRAIT